MSELQKRLNKMKMASNLLEEPAPKIVQELIKALEASMAQRNEYIDCSEGNRLNKIDSMDGRILEILQGAK